MEFAIRRQPLGINTVVNDVCSAFHQLNVMRNKATFLTAETQRDAVCVCVNINETVFISRVVA